MLTSPTTELHVVILAAGKGSRMHSSLPKVLHCIGGKPLLEHVLDAAAALSPTSIHVIVGHCKEQVREAFTDYNFTNDFLMLTADVPLISSQTLFNLCKAMHSFNLAVLTAIVSDPTGLGRIIRNHEDNVVGIVEQKDANLEQQAINEINSGIMCAQASHLKEWLMVLNNNNAQQEYYLTDIVGLANANGQLVSAQSVDSQEEIEGINNRVQLAKVERVYQKKRVEQFMHAGVTVIDPTTPQLATM